jgi:CBS-domain-containing membrane protein
MAVTAEQLVALTASDLMSRDVVMLFLDTPLHAAAELLCQKQVGEAVVVDTDGWCVGELAATDLIHWILRGSRAAADVPSPACSYQVKGRLLTGEVAVICTRAPGSCPLQELRPMTGGRHTAVCLLRDGVVNGGPMAAGVGAAGAVRPYMTAAATVGAEAPLSVLARAVFDGHVHRVIVVDEQHRPIGTVSCLDVLAALARQVRSVADG